MRFKLTPYRVIAGLVVLAALGTLGAWLATVIFGNIGGDRTATLDHPPDRKLIDSGGYLAKLGDCIACHTAPGGKSFAGGLPITTPIGWVYTTNITPDKQTGIGRYSLGDFERAVRRGIMPDGSSLYPAMPFPSYARISDADIRALYAYFTNGVAPVAQVDKKLGILWPLSMRWPLTYWRWMFGPAVHQPSAAAADPVYARGAYLVAGLGHCGSCHTPRGFGLQEKALSAEGGPAYLAGGVVEYYVASNLRGDALTGLGRFSEDDIVRLLQTGRNSDTAVFGGMAEVVTDSTQFMSEEDLRAIAHFLKSLPGSRSEASFAYVATLGSQLGIGTVTSRGSLDYLNNCAACHRSSGKGYTETFPALAGNPVVNSSDPSSLINIVLNGGTMPATNKTPTAFTMPPFGWRLTDKEVADVVTFICSSWGNKASAVDSAQVERIRRATRAAYPVRE